LGVFCGQYDASQIFSAGRNTPAAPRIGRVASGRAFSAGPCRPIAGLHENCPGGAAALPGLFVARAACWPWALGPMLRCVWGSLSSPRIGLPGGFFLRARPMPWPPVGLSDPRPRTNRKALPAALLAYPSFVGQAAFNAAASLHT
jgi:hypothetical protein